MSGETPVKQSAGWFLESVKIYAKSAWDEPLMFTIDLSMRIISIVLCLWIFSVIFNLSKLLISFSF